MLRAAPSNPVVPVARLGWVSLLWACLPCAQAQPAGLDIEAPAEPLSCLTLVRPDRKLPEYPAAVAPGTDAVVRVRLEFTAGDEAPAANVVFNNGPDAFAGAVRDFVANYRLPCLQPGRPYKGVQEFQFVTKRSQHRVLDSVARDDEDQSGALSPECLEGIKNAPPVVFPEKSQITGPVKPGLVLARMRFTAPDKAPEVKVLFDSGQPRLADAALKSVSAYRMKCLQPNDPPFSANQSFFFRWEGATRSQPELTLTQLLSVVAGIKEQKVRFDFTTMGCPFKLTIQAYQPYARNHVKQVGERNPGRRELIEWLRNVSLDLPQNIQRTVLGEPTTVSVPCALLDLS